MKDDKPKGRIAAPYGECKNQLGAIRIYQGVVGTLVRNAVLAVNGVARLAGSTIVDSIGDLIGSQRITDRAIAVALDGNTAAIEVKINFKYGVHIPTVAAEVQAKVVEEVEKATGMKVEKVDVIVQELAADSEEKEAE